MPSHPTQAETSQTASSATALYSRVNAIDGLLVDPDRNITSEIRERFREHLRARFAPCLERGRLSADPLRFAMEHFNTEFAASSRSRDVERLRRPGPLILGLHHPVPSVEFTVLLCSLMDDQPTRPVSVVASFGTLEAISPDFRNQLRAEKMIHEVRFRHDPTGRPFAMNGAEVLSKALNWLRVFDDGIIAIAPCGQKEMWCNVVGHPLRGLSALATSHGRATVFPVSCHGRANLDTFDFALDVQVHDALRPDLEINVAWRDAIIDANQVVRS